MEILDHLLEHDAASTGHLLALCRGMSGEQWLKTFDFGQGSVYATLDHMIDSQEYWTSLMLGQPGPFIPAPTDPTRSLEILTRRFEAVSPAFLTISRQIRDENRLTETFVDDETGPARRTYGSCIVHVATHSMHHRAQIQVMFDLLNVDYNPFGGSALDSYPVD
ncbi:MAG: DinB family protein [Janthinobacterium lividum]